MGRENIRTLLTLDALYYEETRNYESLFFQQKWNTPGDTKTEFPGSIIGRNSLIPAGRPYPRCHEIKRPIRIEQEFNRARAPVVNGPGRQHGRLTHLLP